METKKCISCGRTVLAVSETCKHCGQSFDKDEIFQDEIIEPEAKELLATTPQIVDEQEPVVQQSSSIAGLVEANEDQKKQWWVWIIIAGVLLVGLSVYWVSTTSEKNNNSTEETESKSELFPSETESQVTGEMRPTSPQRSFEQQNDNSEKNEISFTQKAPEAVIKGDRFRIEYILTNKEGRDIKIPETIKGFDILLGPNISTMSSSQFINGRSISSYTETYSYTLIAKDVGTFTIPGATIKVDDKILKSASKQLRVLSPNENKSDISDEQQVTAGSSSIDSSNTFIRTIVSKTKVREQESFTVTFRFYTTLNAEAVEKIRFPEFDGFIVKDVPLSGNRQMQLEHYNGQNYYTLDIKQIILSPQRSGKITIPSGEVEVIFRVKSGKKVQGFFSQFDVMTKTKKAITTNPLTIDVSPTN